MSVHKCWLNLGASLDFDRLASDGVERPYFDIRDPRLNLDFLKQMRSRFGSVGVYVVVNWDNRWPSSPKLFEDDLDLRLDTIAPRTGAQLPCVSVNLEHVMLTSYPGDLPAYTNDFLALYRVDRPRRDTDLVFDAFQGGLWTGRPALIKNIVDAQARVVIECYDGQMHRFDSDAVLQDMRAYGFPEEVLEPMHAKENLTRGWRGYSYIY